MNGLHGSFGEVESDRIGGESPEREVDARSLGCPACLLRVAVSCLVLPEMSMAPGTDRLWVREGRTRYMVLGR